jgi:hypothetical protein
MTTFSGPSGSTPGERCSRRSLMLMPRPPRNDPEYKLVGSFVIVPDPRSTFRISPAYRYDNTVSSIYGDDK